MTDSRPEAYREVRNPRQIKAFADPLRLRILHVLLERQATNQQVADELGEPPAKVFHHTRFLLDVGLIRLVDTRISGRNVEKFYRAVARGFVLRPDGDLLPETRVAALGAELERVRQEGVASAAVWEDDPPYVLRRAGRLDPERLAAFREQLHALVRQFWDIPGQEMGAGPPRTALTIVIYRDPADSAGAPGQQEGAASDE